MPLQFVFDVDLLDEQAIVDPLRFRCGPVKEGIFEIEVIGQVCAGSTQIACVRFPDSAAWNLRSVGDEIVIE